jgi:hypothetical protein
MRPARGAPVARALEWGSFDPAISDDGRFVVFVSFATDLVKEVDIEATPNVYVRDRDADKDGVFDETGPGESATRLLSRAAPEPPAPPGAIATGDGHPGGFAGPAASAP